jgi:hypothetical protein
MELVDCELRRDTNSADEDFGAFLDDDVDKLRELTLCVIVIRLTGAPTNLSIVLINTYTSFAASDEGLWHYR